uniref:Uncharacterized protein n=1 Tax=Zonotrichia albicollis TaxID=44394 RepID=A0A8D2MZF1_ZONAL
EKKQETGKEIGFCQMKPVHCHWSWRDLNGFVMRNNRKGLLPEPNPVQIMKSFNNPAMLQMLLQPQLRGHAVKPVLGASAGLPHLINSAVGPPFLQLNKVHQVCDKNQNEGFLLDSGLAARGEALKCK